jgi:translation elongation factor EF-4
MIQSYASKKSFEVNDLGIMAPEEVSNPTLYSGQVGYVVLGMKTTKEAFIGDTLHHVKCPVEPLPGFRKAKSMVFAGVFPK